MPPNARLALGPPSLGGRDQGCCGMLSPPLLVPGPMRPSRILAHVQGAARLVRRPFLRAPLAMGSGTLISAFWPMCRVRTLVTDEWHWGRYGPVLFPSRLRAADFTVRRPLANEGASPV